MLLADYITSDVGQASLTQVGALLSKLGVRLFYINMAEPYFAFPFSPIPPAVRRIPPPWTNVVTRVVQQTGGLDFHYVWHVAYRVPGRGRQFSSSDISTLVQTIYALVRNVYRVELPLKTPLKKKKGLKIEILDTRGRKRKDLNVSYPSVLLPLPSTDENR